MPSRRMPAGLMTACRPLNVSSACWTMCLTPEGLVTLSELETASPPFALISRTTSSAGPAEPSSPPATLPPRSLTTTLAPSRAAISAHSLPMPFAPPVTRTTLPSNTPMGLVPCFSARKTSEATVATKEQTGKWNIRPERPEDAPLVEALNAVSFGPGRYAKSAYRLREGVAAEAALSFVAVEKAALRGSVRFWPVIIGKTPALLLGPLAVQSDQRGRGIGIALMTRGMEEAKALGHRFIVLVGDPPYYGRVGF